MAGVTAKKWTVRGKVQGVGFRYFVEGSATSLGLKGWVRNQDDGSVLAYAVGTEKQLNDLAAVLHKGPRMAEVRGVDEEDAPVQDLQSFRVV